MNNSAKAITFKRQLASGKVNTNKLIVANAIRTNYGIDTAKLRNTLKMSHQSLTGTISNLLDLGVIEIVGTTEYDELIYSKYKFVDDENRIKENQTIRLMCHYIDWQRRGLKDFTQFLDEATIDFLTNK
jgi:hypothetical protein